MRVCVCVLLQLHSITVDVNRIITNLQTITITREQLLQSTTATDKNCVIFMEISYIMPTNNEGKGLYQMQMEIVRAIR